MRQAFEQALEGFSDPKCPELKGLEIPRSPLSVDSVPAERQRYVTLDRIIKYGPTPGCKGCTFDSRRHTPICKVRFDGLVRADKAAEARVKDKGPLELPRPDEVEDEIIDPEPKPYDGEPSDAEGPDAAVSEHTPSLHDYRDAEPRDDDIIACMSPLKPKMSPQLSTLTSGYLQTASSSAVIARSAEHLDHAGIPSNWLSIVVAVLMN